MELKPDGFGAILNNREIGIAILNDALKYRQVNRVLSEFNGISPEQQLDLIKDMGCGCAQGFYFGRAISLAHLYTLSRSNSLKSLI